MDDLTHISGYTSKDTYNMNLDKRIIELYNLADQQYTAQQFCSIILENKRNIFKVWIEEENSVTEKRYELFVKGASKFLNRNL